MSYFFIFAGAILRLLPHLPNFAPIAAMALFGGVYLNKKYAFGVPILALLISDYFIGFYNIWVMLSVYGSFFIIGLLGLWLRKHKTILNTGAITLSSSVIFFIVTNFVVWAAPPSMYSHNWQGLTQSYIMGLPFFRNTLLGDFFYVGAMFGLMELAIIITNRFTLKKERVTSVVKELKRRRI